MKVCGSDRGGIHEGVVQIFQLLRKELFPCVKVVLPKLNRSGAREEGRAGNAYFTSRGDAPPPPPHSSNPVLCFLDSLTHYINGMECDIAIGTECWRGGGGEEVGRRWGRETAHAVTEQSENGGIHSSVWSVCSPRTFFSASNMRERECLSVAL